MQPYPDVLLLTIFYFRRHILASYLLVAGGDNTTKSITVDSHTYYYYFTHTHKIPTTELSRFSSSQQQHPTCYLFVAILQQWVRQRCSVQEWNYHFSERNFKRRFVCINFTTALRRSGVELQLFRGKFQASFRVHILYRQRCSVQEWNYNFSEGNFKRRFVCIKLFHSSTWAYKQNMKAHIRPIHFCALCTYFLRKNLCGVSIGRIEVTCGRIYMAGLWAC